MLHSVYDQPDAEAVHAQFDKLLDVTQPLKQGRPGRACAEHRQIDLGVTTANGSPIG